MKQSEVEGQIERCAKCGQCRTICPLFSALKDEKFVARGRLSLIQAARTGKNNYQIFDRVINTCLSCRRCENNCPSLVKTGEVFKYERIKLAKRNGLPAPLSFAFRWVLPKRWLYDLVLRLASWASGVWRLLSGRLTLNGQRSTLNALHPLRHLPLYFANILQRISNIVSEPALTIRNSQFAIRNAPQVGIFIGCATNYFYPDIIKSLVSLLERQGISYEIPSQQTCCGMPVLLSGDEQSARRLIRINKECLKYNTVITVCPSCNRMLSENITRTGVKVIDAIEFLDGVIGLSADVRVYINTIYHQPCHSDGTRTPEIIKTFLKTKTQYKEIENLCCGGGGLFTFKYPDLSHQIGQYKMKSIDYLEGKQNYIITNCPGCLMQLEYLIRATKADDLKVSHFLTFYDSPALP